MVQNLAEYKKKEKKIGEKNYMGINHSAIALSCVYEQSYKS